MITIRPATLADTKDIVALEMTIIDQMALPMVQKIGRANVQQVLYESALADEKARYSYTRTLIAEMSGATVGMIVGYPAADESVLDTTGQRLLAERFGELQSMFPDTETLPGEWYIDTVSVSEKARGKGCGTALVQAAAKLAQDQGYSVIGLNVDDANPKARALYEKLEFEPVTKMMLGSHQYTHMQWRLG